MYHLKVIFKDTDGVNQKTVKQIPGHMTLEELRQHIIAVETVHADRLIEAYLTTPGNRIIPLA